MGGSTAGNQADIGQKQMIKTMLCGSGAGAFAKTCIAPIERVKINFQVGQKPFSFAAGVLFARELIQAGGVGALWKGNSASVAAVLPSAGIRFMCYDKYKEHTHRVFRGAPAGVPLVAAGALSGVTSVLVTYPLDLMRARLAVINRAEYSGLVCAMRSVLYTEGPLGFYRGIFPTLCGILPYTGIGFASNDLLKQWVIRQRNGEKLTVTLKMTCGALAGLTAQLCTYPFDTVKRRLQVQSASQVPGQARKGWIGVFRQILAEGGVLGFWKGVTLNVIKGPLATGISFAAFDVLKEVFNVGAPTHSH